MLRGEVWLIDLDPTVGAEMRKTRPAVIVSSDRIGILPLKVVVPLTGWKERYSGAPWFIQVEPDQNSGLDKTSAADTFQVRSVAQQRFVRRIGLLSAPIMTAISAALAEVLEIGSSVPEPVSGPQSAANLPPTVSGPPSSVSPK